MKMHMAYIAVLAGLLSCTNTVTHSPVVQQSNTESFNLARLEAERTAWECQAMNQYRFTGQGYSTAKRTIPITVTVWPDAEPELSYIQSLIPNEGWHDKIGDELIKSDNPFVPFFGKTIDELYNDIERCMRYYINTQHTTGIRYNQTYHYPENVFVYFSGTNSAGNVFSLTITQFEDLR